ncbi:MAG TPA: hypothetical protein PLJ35_12145 [Anaerolineae bacterium]|nr:hypothetical protein [Anaerolineae bacterium]HPL27928.1 hypothetical protein [Anaerolineae bacterium]
MGKFLVAVIVILLIVGVVVLGLGYLGLVPGVAGLFGSDRPRDLGVRYTAADLASGNAKSGTKTTALPAGSAPQASYQSGGSIPVQAAFTDEELTAIIAERAKQWAYFPVSDAQIKIGDDGTVQAAGVLRVDRAYGCATALGFSTQAVDTALSTLKVLNGNVPVYVRGTGSVSNGQVIADLQQVEVGRLTVPAGLLGDKALIATTIEQVIEASGVSANSVTFANGELRFDGSKPETRGLSAAQ